MTTLKDRYQVLSDSVCRRYYVWDWLAGRICGEYPDSATAHNACVKLNNEYFDRD